MLASPRVIVILAAAVGLFALVTTFVIPWNSTGFVDGVTTLVPVPIAFGAGLLMPRKQSCATCAVMAVTIEISQEYVNPFVIVITMGPWLVAVVLREHQQMVRRLARVGAELESESHLLAQEAIRLERNRIAHELHDIVAHCVSMMVVQAYAGERLVAADQEAAAAAFDHISAAVERARDEIAHLVDLLADEPPAVSDEPLSARLRALVAGTAGTGLPVRLQVHGHPDELSPESAAIAYRVVQEGLTNALKHAPGAPIVVSLECGPDVRIDVINRLPESTDFGLASTGGGHGLVGMRERVEGMGGKFDAGPEDAGPEDAGAWRVSVNFPARA